ncbi:MAG TPA: thioredoxin family protein [Phycisphaerae bacterium]|nr:thioredoxin family protein [Phycisphaerae bacterium]
MTELPLPERQTVSTWRRYGWPALILLVAAVVYGTSLRPFAKGLDWSDDYAQARRESAESGRPLLIEFFSPSCPYCSHMERDTLVRSEVKELLTSFARVRVNAWEAQELSTRYAVDAVPAYVALDANERLIARVEGYLPADEFNEFLRRALEAAPTPRAP